VFLLTIIKITGLYCLDCEKLADIEPFNPVDGNRTFYCKCGHILGFCDLID